MSARSRSSAVYLYGLVRADQQLDLGPIGIDEDGAPALVYTLPAGRVGAVISARKDRNLVLPVRRDLSAHQRVIARAMEAGTILPFAFGQVAGSEREVLRLLRARESSFAKELDRLEGKVQMGLKVHWEVDNIFQYIIDADPELAGLRESVFASPVPSLAERIKLGERFAESLQAKREALVDSIVAALDVSVAPPKELPVRTEKAVADLMFLIERSDRERFEEGVRQLATAWPHEFTFRVTGPWAPFNFVEIQLSVASGEGD